MDASADLDPVFRYTEQQLQRLDEDDDAAGLPARRNAPQLVRCLLASETPAQRELLVRGMLSAIGFNWFAYGVTRLERGRHVAKSFFTTYAHPAWTERYFDERYHELDPRHVDAPQSGLPLVWDLDDLDARLAVRPPSGRARRFAEDFRDSGIRSGVFFHLTPPHTPHERVVISLMSSMRGCGWIVDPVLGQALTLGLCMHEFLSRHVRPVQPAHAPRRSLSALQQEILQCLMRGQSDKEIAYGLSLSPHVVDYHMRQLRKRFAARNRVELVNAAAMH
jgi:DNA-binding CsgD family transcriptional regulator